MKFYQKITKIVTDVMPYFLHRKFSNKIDAKMASLFIKDSGFIQNFGILIAEGEECVILGNGPSLKDSLKDPKTLEFIKQRKKFCVNESVRSEDFLQLKPDYVAFMDLFYWSKDVPEPFRSSYIEMNEILSKADWKIKIFLPTMAKDWNFFIDVPQKNKNVEIIYIDAATSLLQDDKMRFLEYKQNLSMPRAQNVLVGCLYIAINIGFDNIYVFGADHTWHQTIYIDDENKLRLKDEHFYDNEAVDKAAFKNAQGEMWIMSDYFQALSNTYKSYDELEKYAQYMDCKVFNSSLISYIDAFERKKAGV